MEAEEIKQICCFVKEFSEKTSCIQEALNLLKWAENNTYTKITLSTLNKNALNCTALQQLLYTVLYCICIVMRGGIYDEIQHELVGNPEAKARVISRGHRLYFILYPDSLVYDQVLSINTVQFVKLTCIPLQDLCQNI